MTQYCIRYNIILISVGLNLSVMILFLNFRIFVESNLSLSCNTEKDKSKTLHNTAGTVVKINFTPGVDHFVTQG